MDVRQFVHVTKLQPKKKKKNPERSDEIKLKKKKKIIKRKKKTKPAAMMMGFEPHDLHKSAQTIVVDVSDSVPAALR